MDDTDTYKELAMATTTRTRTTTTRTPYYRYDKVSDTMTTVDLLWVAKAAGYSLTDTGELQARLARGEVVETTLARFATDATQARFDEAAATEYAYERYTQR